MPEVLLSASAESFLNLSLNILSRTLMNEYCTIST